MKNGNLNAVGRETEWRLKALVSGDESSVKANLAALRHGLGLSPGAEPKLWGMLFYNLPEDFLGSYGKPSKEEWAIYNALTLYALHQQGYSPQTSNMDKADVSLGCAAGKLVAKYGGTDEDRERVSRRFNQIALAQDIETLTYYLRTFIPILREESIELDYPKLAKDLYLFQFDNSRDSVRLRWGRDYYRIEKAEADGSADNQNKEN